MPDLIDDANATAEVFLTAALRKSHQQGRTAPPATGACLYCATPVAADHRWCDTECRGFWEAEQRR